jgi:hypothetical protein
MAKSIAGRAKTKYIGSRKNIFNRLLVLAEHQLPGRFR